MSSRALTLPIVERIHAPFSKATSARPLINGKFLSVGLEHFWVKGSTYGTFSERSGCDYPPPTTVAMDFQSMAAHGLNTVRTYTVPPAWLLDLAMENGLRVLVGMPWEQHIAFLNDGKTVRSIEKRVRDSVRSCGRHPAILGYTIGNEVPAPIVRWHGKLKFERFLGRLYENAKEQDPDALVTYVNYPSTEYLELPFL